MKAQTDLLIDGEWRTGNGLGFESRDPATGGVVWSGRSADRNDVAAACAAAREAFPAWEDVPLAGRAEVLHRFADVLKAHDAALVGAICRETGKPRWEARTEIESMIGKIGVSIAAHAQRCGEFRSGPAVTRFRPHGVVAVFGPFNFPGHLPNGHIVPALLAGNSIVFKPSERSPATAALIAACWLEAGLPRGVLNLVQGGRETGQALSNDPEIDGVFFTGSAAVGMSLHKQFAERPDKILALEMGGNNPLVVWSVRDPDAAAIATVQSAYITAGQRCTCARRLIVCRDRTGDEFLARLEAAISAIRVGAWTDDPEPFMGPVIGPDAAESLVAAQAALVRNGARALVPLRHLATGTGRVSPGLVDVTAVENRADDELFGPLLQVIRVADFDAAIAEANITHFGLAAGLFSDDDTLWLRFRRSVRAGIVNWNRSLTGASSSAPFGGTGLSGNHRPSAFFAADYCSFPVAGIEVRELTRPALLPPGLAIEGVN